MSKTYPVPASQPVEVQARSAIATAIVSLFVQLKQDAAIAKDNRESRFNDLRTYVVSAGKLTDVEINNIQAEYSAKATQAGLKANSIKVVKSEIGRILAHRDVWMNNPDCTTWKQALRYIREATVDKLEIARDDAIAALAALDKARETVNDVVVSYMDHLNNTRPANTAAYTVEQVADMIKSAIAAKNVQPDVTPINAEKLLRASPITVTPAPVKAMSQGVTESNAPASMH